MEGPFLTVAVNKTKGRVLLDRTKEGLSST